MAATAKSKALQTYVGSEKADIATSFADQVDLLSATTPPQYIKKRKGRGGREFDYVEFNYVAGRLNAAFAFKWDVEIMDKVIDTKGNQIAMWIRLTVHFLDGTKAHKDAWGSAEIKRGTGDGSIVDLGDDLKAAQSDGIKKAASMLGICWDVYSGQTKGNGGNGPRDDDIIDADPLDDKPPDHDPADFSDLSSNPDEDMAEVSLIVDDIRHAVDAAGIEYTAFKNYLMRVQGKMNPKRKLVGKKFGNASLTEGNPEDLRYLKDNLDKAIEKFNAQSAPRAQEEGKDEQVTLL